MTELKHYDLKNGFDSFEFYEKLHAFIACHLLTLKQAGRPAELVVNWRDMEPFGRGETLRIEIEAGYESLTLRLHGGDV